VPIHKGLRITKQWLEHEFKLYADTDDVFRSEFLEGVVFVGALKSEIEVTDDASILLENLGTKWTEYSEKPQNCSSVSPGPCALIQGKYFKVLRLFEDSSKAFVVGVKSLANE